MAKDIKNDISATKKLSLPWWGVLCIIAGALLLYWLFDQFGRPEIALPALNSAAMLLLAITLKWKLRRQLWFWITMSILAVLHVPLVLFVPWGTSWVPALAIAVIDLMDISLILMVLATVGNVVAKLKA